MPSKDDLQKILVQTKEQQKIINKKMNDGLNQKLFFLMVFHLI